MKHTTPTVRIDDDFELDDSSESGAPEASLRSRMFAGPLNPDALFGRHMLWRACPPKLRRAAQSRRPAVIILEVDDADWCEPIQSAARCVFRPGEVVRETTDGKARPAHASSLLTCTGKGYFFTTITTNAAILGAELLAAADFHLRIKRPNAGVVAAVVRSFFDADKCPPVPREVGRQSTAAALLSTVRKYETPERAIARLRCLDRRNRENARLDGVALGPRLEDLEGYGEAKTWGLQLAADIAAFKRGKIHWDALSSAAVLHGQPGSGKTYFASALARSCGIPLVQTSIGELFSQTRGYLDSIIKGMDAAFEDARRKAPSLLFIDEIDGLPNRYTMGSHGRDWWTPIVNHFLKLLDNSRDRVVVLGATNMLSALDPAIIRPGRLERHLEVKPPDERELASILRQYLRDRLQDIDMLTVARMTLGATGAQAAQWVKAAEAHARLANRPLQLEDLLDQVAPERWSEDELLRIAVHEAGHATVALALGLQVDQVSTIPRAGFEGWTKVEQRGGIRTRRKIEDFVLIALGGRAAEIILLGDASIGAEGDLGSATRLLASLHGSLGLGDSLVQRSAPADATSLLSDPDFRQIVQTHLAELHEQAVALLTIRRPLLECISQKLQTRRILIGNELFEGEPAPARS